MSTWYVCIDNSYSTSGNGTSSIPFQYSQFLNFSGTNGSILQNNDIINISGVRSTNGIYDFLTWTSIPSSANNLTIKSWDSSIPTIFDFEDGDLYWQFNKVNNLTFNFENLIFKNFHIYYNSSVVVKNTFNLSNMIFTDYVYLSDFVNNELSASSYNINGCSFYNTEVILADSYFNSTSESVHSATYNFNDSVFISSRVYTDITDDDGLGKVNFNFCVFSGTSAVTLSGLPTSALTISSCTFNLSTNTVFPNVSAITPLNKGNIVFENYNLDYSFTTRRTQWLNTITSAALYGSNRRGPGYFYFPYNTFYVDLSSTSTSGVGSLTKPMGGRTFSADNNFYSNDNVKIRGSLNFTGYENYLNFCGASAVSLDAWDVSAYGPWKITFSGDNSIIGSFGFSYANNFYFKNGIIVCKDSNVFGQPVLWLPSLSLENMFIQTSSYSDSEKGVNIYFYEIDNNTVKMRGLTLSMVSGSSINFPSNPFNNISLIARDCVFDMRNFCLPLFGSSLTTSAYFDNCVFSAATSGVEGLAGDVFNPNNLIITNSQFGWNPSIWPNMYTDISKEQMDFNVLTSGTHNFTISGSENW